MVLGSRIKPKNLADWGGGGDSERDRVPVVHSVSSWHFKPDFSSDCTNLGNQVIVYLLKKFNSCLYNPRIYKLSQLEP